MKKSTIKGNGGTNTQTDMGSTKEWVNRTLKEIHKRMVELFGVDFTYFRDVKIINHSDILKQIMQRMRDDLIENGVMYSEIQWKQILESLSKNQIPGFFENLAFYNPKDEVLYMSEKMITDHTEKMIPVCTHELSEKLLSTYLSLPLKTPIRALVEAYIEVKKTNNRRRFYDLLNTYADIIFKNVFKEGCCEAIALQTLHHIGSEMKTASLEKELLVGHSKCIDVLFDLEEAKRNIECMEKSQTRLNEKRQRIRAEDEDKLVREIVGSSQTIKGISYYLGYPLAKAVLEKYGIKGVKLALEKYPPLEAQYFANTEAYLAKLEEIAAFTE